MATAARKKTAVSNGNGEVEVLGASFSAEALAGISSFDDALKLVGDTLGQENVLVADEVLGDGFKLLNNKEKDTLLGVPFLAVTWNFTMGDFEEFVSVKIVTQDGRKLIVNDGSTGMCDQLRQFSNSKNQRGGLFVRKGLRKSDYTYTDDKGEEKPAVTYYLDTSA